MARAIAEMLRHLSVEEDELRQYMLQLHEDGELNEFDDHMRSVITSGAPAGAMRLLLRLVISRVLELKRQDLLHELAVGSANAAFEWAQNPIPQPATMELLSVIHEQMKAADQYVGLARQAGELNELRDALLRRKGVEVILDSLPAEEQQFLLLPVTPDNYNEAHARKERLIKAVEGRLVWLLSGWLEDERRRRSWLLEHPDLLDHLEGGDAMVMLEEITERSPIEYREAFARVVQQLEQLHSERQAEMDLSSQLEELRTQLPLAVRFADGWIGASLRNSIDGQIRYVMDRRGCDRRQAVAIVARTLHDLEAKSAETEQSMTPVAEEFDHKLSTAIDLWEQIHEKYSYLIGLEHPGFKKNLLIEGPEETLMRMQREGQPPMRSIDKLLEILAQKKEQLARTKARFDSQIDDGPAQAQTGYTSPKRRSSAAKRRGAAVSTKPKGSGPPVGGPNVQSGADRGRIGRNAKGAVSGTKGASRRATKKGK